MAIALACSCRPPPKQITLAPAPAAAKPAPQLPPAITAELDRALKAANATTPPWKADGAALAGGLLVERYVLQGGPTLVFSRDATSPAITYQTWIALGEEPGGKSLEPETARAILELLRFGPLSDQMRGLESLGALTSIGHSAGWGAVRTTFPLLEGETGVFAKIAALEAERIAAPPPISAPEWNAIVDRARGAGAPAARRTLSRVLGERIAKKRAQTLGLDGLTAERARELLGAIAVPSRLVIAVSGNVDRGEVLAEVRRVFAPLLARAKSAPPPAPKKMIEPGAGAGRQVVEIPGPAEALLLGFAIPPSSSPEHLPLTAIAHLISGGDESRLGRALLADLAHGVEARASENSFEIFVAMKPGKTATAATALIDRELRAIARGETTGLEVEIVRASLRADALEELDRLERRAGALARSTLSGLDPASFARRLEAIATLAEPELRAAAGRYLAARYAVELAGKVKR